MARGGRGSLLHVTIISATLSPSTSGRSGSDSADSYATVICGNSRFTTRTAEDQGTLPTWNESHTFKLEDTNEWGLQDVIVEIFAAKADLDELLGIAKLSLSRIVSANEETSLHSLSRPNYGDCGQVKVALRLESLVDTTRTQTAAMYGGYDVTRATDTTYPPQSTEPSAPVYPDDTSNSAYPDMGSDPSYSDVSSDPQHPGPRYPNQGPAKHSFQGPPAQAHQQYRDPNAPADAAASAFAGLAIGHDNNRSGYESPQTPYLVGSAPSQSVPYQHTTHDSSPPAYPPQPQQNSKGLSQPGAPHDSGSYPPYPGPASGQYPPQGHPYLASPIGGVVTGYPHGPSSMAYTHPPPFQTTHKSGEKNSSDPSSAYYGNTDHPSASTYPGYPPAKTEKSKKDKNSPPPNYSGYAASSESYPPASTAYPPNTGNQSHPNLSQYGTPAPHYPESHLPVASQYPPNLHSQYPSSADPSLKGESKKSKESGHAAVPYGAPSTPYPGMYPPEAKSGYPPNSNYPPPSSNYDPHAPPAGYPGQHNVEQGKQKVKGGDKGDKKSKQGSGTEGVTQEKGGKLGHGLAQPYGGHSGYGYAQPGYVQPGYSQPGYPQYGYPPSYPPADPAHGYPPQAYPTGYGYGGHGGYGAPYEQHGHVPTPYGHTPALHGSSHGHVGHGSSQHGHYESSHGGHKFKGHKKSKKYKGHHGHHGHHGH